MSVDGCGAVYRDAVAKIYARYLPKYPASIDDGLFDLGADSLSVVNLVVDLEQTFGVSIPYDQLIDVESVRQMANWLAAQGAPLPAVVTSQP